LREYLAQETACQLAEIARRASLFRSVRPAVPIAERSVIVTDDGIATGSTMFAALQTVRAQNPRELIVAVPVGPADRVEEIGQFCDEVVCLQSPPNFRAVGQFYLNFQPVEDDEVVELLQSATAAKKFSRRQSA
jgi:predicted phosphoribosyltransferase